IGDVEDKIAIVIDDMVDTAGTLTEAAGVIQEKGARQVHAYCTHPVLSGPAIDRISQSSLDSLVATDTIPLSAEAQKCEKIKTLSIAKLVGEAIMRSYRGDSVNSLFI
ncbi:MAG: ribose-phosphate diphosphokinase, partial [Desulfotignum sp.]